MTSPAADIARQFWTLMQSNDFAAVATVLAPDFVLEWPQTNERIRGAANFVRMNAEYPAQGRWEFTLHRLVGGEREAVSDVGVTDGALRARAISFFEIADGRVRRIVEYWPEAYEPPANRAHLVERMD